MCLVRKRHRQALRAAVRIREHLTGGSHVCQLPELPIARWYELRRMYRRLESVHRRGWKTASVMLASDLDYQFNQLTRELEAVRARLPKSAITQQQIQQAGAIASDLVALADEFEAIEIDLKEKRVSVDTADIVLEDVDLGAFRIGLRWEKIGNGWAYRIDALTPHCPTTRSDITHPHVSNHTLCEGAGASAIRNALVSGRLFDFFVLVRQILETYNSSSPYVALDKWYAEETECCHDCGGDVPSDYQFSCNRCGDILCDDCSLSCGECENTNCASCRDRCAVCEQSFCHTCLDTPAGSNQLLCAACLQQQEEAHEEDECEITPSDAICLGEAAAVA